MSLRFIRTKNLNIAAALTTFGAKLVEIEDTYPNNIFVVETNPFHRFLERHIGMIPYRRFCKERTRIKIESRKKAGLPARFTGKDEGFNFGDSAMVRKYSKKELARMASKGLE